MASYLVTVDENGRILALSPLAPIRTGEGEAHAVHPLLQPGQRSVQVDLEEELYPSSEALLKLMRTYRLTEDNQLEPLPK